MLLDTDDAADGAALPMRTSSKKSWFLIRLGFSPRPVLIRRPSAS
jgi:hypothetical protein